VSAFLSHDAGWLVEVERRSGEPIRKCYYCLKCSAGCPTAYAMDDTPAQVLRRVQMGDKSLLAGDAIWLCVGCQTCLTRCPNGISAGNVMDALKQIALEERSHPGQRRILVLHRRFLESIRLFGRVHELSMLALYKVLSLDLFTDLDLGARMFVRGKIPILPERMKGMKQIRALFSRRGEAQP
jgi:heterodisulfide reductase subunit C2